MEALHVFTTLCTALGTASPLVLSTWQHEIVNNNLNGDIAEPWQFVYALILVNLEDIDENLNTEFAYIMQLGSMDYMRRRARTSALVMFPNYTGPSQIFRPSGSESDGTSATPGHQRAGNPKEVGPKGFNGEHTAGTGRPCTAWNNGREHKQHNLYQDRTCKYSDGICDQFVSDQGPRGICKGTHKRSACTNPAKCDKPQN